MNLNQISIKNFILALFKRDDGERILLGSGAYEFDAELQHFAANIIANDVIEKQGTDGQLLAGQVRRCAPQSFDGFVGDASTSREDTENYRRAFIRFFQPRHFYTVIYILPDGTAIQRKNGYLTDAPAVPEQYQKSPRYHVALAFEDLNYYSYAEDAQGDETYAQTVSLQPESELTGGLVWNAIGTVWEPESKRLTGINGDTFQQSYSGKNLFDRSNMDIRNGYLYNNELFFATNYPDRTFIIPCEPNTTYTVSRSVLTSSFRVAYSDIVPSEIPATTGRTQRIACAGQTNNNQGYTITITTGANAKALLCHYGHTRNDSGTINQSLDTIMVEEGSTSTSFEPFVGGQPSPNPDYPQPIQTVAGTQTITIDGTDYPLDLGDIELAEFDGFQDHIFKDGSDWKLHKETGKFVFTEETTPTAGRSKNGSIGFVLNAENNPLTGKHIPMVGACSHFDIEGGLTTWTGINKTGMNSAGALWFQTGDSERPDSRTIAQFFDWLASSSVVYKYALATPAETVITDQTLINQLEAISGALGSGATPTITPAQGNLPAVLTTESTGVGGGAVWDAETGHATTTITVNGLYAVSPIWTVPGPAESPLIENITNNTSLSYLGQIPAGQSLIVDCGNQTATIAGANVKNNIRGTWQTFEPGQTTIRYSGANITAPSTLEWNEVVG